MKRNNLLAYAQSFASFLIDSDESNKIDNIVVFGSVAADRFDDDSDIDIFVDTKIDKVSMIKQLRLFESSNIAKVWHSKGVKNPISLHTGELKKHVLKSSLLSNGVQLYGKFKQMPNKIDYYCMYVLNFGKLKRKDKVKIWRKLYGYKQVVNSKKYETDGVVFQFGGKRVEKNIILIPAENKSKFANYLLKNKIDHMFYEIWTRIE